MKASRSDFSNKKNYKLQMFLNIVKVLSQPRAGKVEAGT